MTNTSPACTLLPAYAQYSEAHPPAPTAPTPSLPSFPDLGYLAGRLNHVVDQESAERMAQVISTSNVSHIGFDSEFRFSRDPVTLPNGKPWYDIRSVVPLVISFAVVIHSANPIGKALLLCYVVNVRVPAVLPALIRVLHLTVPFVAHAFRNELFVLWHLGLPTPAILWDSWVAERSGNIGQINAHYAAPTMSGDAEEAEASENARQRRDTYCSLTSTCQRHVVVHRFAGSKSDLQASFLTFEPGSDLSETQLAYAAEDALAEARLYRVQVAQAAERGGLDHLVRVEMPWAVVSAAIEWDGIRVDQERTRRIWEAALPHLEQISRDLLVIMESVATAAGEDPRAARLRWHLADQTTALRLLDEARRDDCTAEAAAVHIRGLGLHRSRSAVITYLDLRGLLPLFQTDGKPVLSQDAYKEFQQRDEAVALLYAAKRIEALIKDSILHPGLVGADGRIHPQQVQLGTDSGRQTTKNPNIHGLPSVLRPIVVPAPGNGIAEIDLSQIEIGVAGAVYRCEALIRVFNEGDAYVNMAKAHYRAVLSAEELALDVVAFKATPRLKKMRGEMKTMTLGLLYGLRPQSLADTYGISLAEAERQFRDFFRLFPGLVESQARYVEESGRRGWASSCTGLRRYRAGLGKASTWERNWMVNLRVQGSAAAAFKMAGIRILPRLQRLQTRIIIAVHDAYVIEGPLDTLGQAAEIVSQELCLAVETCFPVLEPRAEINLVDPSCWNKEGQTQEWSAWLSDYRVFLKPKGV